MLSVSCNMQSINFFIFITISLYCFLQVLFKDISVRRKNYKGLSYREQRDETAGLYLFVYFFPLFSGKEV